ncbi:hypothetical protein ACFFGH_34430 [Lysobacter korlensis]|uniref:Uncharacterized protein n=1 Tax=Lysobacter korlensis TaxID=553636 RepID=A0ABV6S140_9GAMM
MTWLTLSHSQILGGNVQFRFRPDVFLHEQDAPVLEVTVEGAEDPETAITLLARFREDFVVDLEIEAQELRVLGEMDDEETVVRGDNVFSRHVPYSIEELRQMAIFFERRLREERSDAYRQAKQFRDIRHFVTDLIDRAEKKRSLSSKACELTEAQLSVLHRVLNRLDDA